MKRIFLTALCLFAAFLISCGGRSYEILPFEGKSVTASCLVNDKFSVVIEKRDERLSLSVLSPTEISGLEFLFSRDGDLIISENIKIPVQRSELSGIYALSSLFNIEEETMVSAVSRDGCGNITFKNQIGEYLLIFDKDGYVTDAKITGEGFCYNVKILSVKIE